MAEEIEGQDIGAEAVAGGVDPAAVALALSGASREDAGVFLKKQSALIDDQRHHLHRQLVQVELRIWEQRFGLLLRIAAGFIGLAIAAGLAFMIWDAVHSNGLIIEAFSVPPDLASRGLTGQVVASEVLDKLTSLQNDTLSVRPAKSYANDWGSDLRVEIPETGVSVGDFRRFLHEWLGNETHISGEITRTTTGIAVAARTGHEGGATFTGPESDLDTLIQKVAEQIYAITQPYRYGFFLRQHSRLDEAKGVLDRLTADANPAEAAWAWHGLAGTFYLEGDFRASVSADRKAIALNPDFDLAFSVLSSSEYVIGHAEDALIAAKTAAGLMNHGSVPDVAPISIPRVRRRIEEMIASQLGDYGEAANAAGENANNPTALFSGEFEKSDAATWLARQHDAARAQAILRDMPPSILPLDNEYGAIARVSVEAAGENWPAVIASEASAKRALAGLGNLRDGDLIYDTQLRPLLALAKAGLGDIRGAEAVIAPTPANCYDCIRTRGLIASTAKQFGRADYWFARAVHDGLSIPFAYTDWGQVLLARGKPDAAIEKFKLANRKGPHFADPLEGWGEALMAKNQSHLALAKFAEADKYAPNWGRLHLKWGEALFYTGHKDEAHAQFQKTSTLDLSATEKAELAGMRHG